NVTMPPALPSTVGTLTAEHPGFTSYPQATIRVQVAVASRLDVTWQMAIDAGGPGNRRILMRKTESGEPPATTAADTIHSLPIHFGIASGAIRNRIELGNPAT